MFSTDSDHSTKIVASGMPKDWTINQIQNRFAVVGQIKQINMIKNAMGATTGKAIITFGNKASVKDAIIKYDNRAVDDLVTYVKPFKVKG